MPCQAGFPCDNPVTNCTVKESSNELNNEPNFLNDAEKMADFKALPKDEFLKTYSYINETEYNEIFRKFFKNLNEEV